VSEIDEAPGDSEQEIAIPGQEAVVDVREALPEGTGHDEGGEPDISTPLEGLEAASDGVVGDPVVDESLEDDGAAADEAWPAPSDLGAPSLPAALEAILLVVDEPVSEVTLAQVLERPTGEVIEALRGIAADYDEAERGFELREVGGGWRLYTRPSCAAVVERFVVDGQQARLTQAALETLAIVAYRQPVSRARISAVRGVNVDGVIRTLVSRGLVEECGSEPDSGALLYRTTSVFLERVGLRTIDELPDLAPLLPDIQSLESIHDSI
jgi:segregation and condensation protein B